MTFGRHSNEECLFVLCRLYTRSLPNWQFVPFEIFYYKREFIKIMFFSDTVVLANGLAGVMELRV